MRETLSPSGLPGRRSAGRYLKVPWRSVDHVAAITWLRSRGCEELRDPNRIIRDGDSRLLECLDLRLRRATVPLDDRPRMAHPLPGRRRPASDVCHDRFRDPSLDEVRGLLLRRAADLADDDDSFCIAVFLEHREAVHHAGADD